MGGLLPRPSRYCGTASKLQVCWRLLQLGEATNNYSPGPNLPGAYLVYRRQGRQQFLSSSCLSTVLSLILVMCPARNFFFFFLHHSPSLYALLPFVIALVRLLLRGGSRGVAPTVPSAGAWM